MALFSILGIEPNYTFELRHHRLGNAIALSPNLEVFPIAMAHYKEQFCTGFYKRVRMRLNLRFKKRCMAAMTELLEYAIAIGYFLLK